MSDARTSDQLEFFRALADRSRLRIVGMLAGREYSVQELARALKLRAPTVSHHLAVLKGAGLAAVRSDGTTRWYRLQESELNRKSRELLSRSALERIGADQAADSADREVLAHYLEGERLTKIPDVRKKRLVVLRWLARKFDPGVDYREGEVNTILKRHHPDAATLRREMVGNRIFAREAGVYRLRPESEWKLTP
jgi:DNA-binding transcriptional ArsR family regulator